MSTKGYKSGGPFTAKCSCEINIKMYVVSVEWQQVQGSLETFCPNLYNEMMFLPINQV